MRRLMAVGVLCFSSGTACVFDPAVPGGARITCTSSADCPNGDVCVGVGVGTCVAPDDADRDGPQAVEISATPARLARDGVLTLAFDVSEPLAIAPVIQIGGASAEAPQLTGPFSIDVDANAIGTGPQRAVIVLQDTAGNVGTSLGPPIEVDVDAPGVVAGSVTVSVTAPPFVTTPVTALELYGAVEVGFEADDDLLALPVVTAEGPSSLPLVLTASLGRAFSYRLDLDTPAPVGSYTVTAAMVDDFDNAGTVEVGAFDLVASDAPQCIARHADGTLACADRDGDGFIGLNVDCSPTVPDCDDDDALVHPGALDLPQDGVDGDCVGGDVVGGADNVLYVTPGALPGGAGTPASPMTLVEATAASAEAVLLAVGSYPLNNVIQFDDRHVIGGLDPVTWQQVGVSTLIGTGDPTDPVVRITGQGRETRIAHLAVQSAQCEAVSILTPTILDTPLWLVDVTVDQQIPGGCTEATGIIHANRRVHLVRTRVTMTGTVPEAAGLRMSDASTERMTWVDTSFDVRITGAATGLYSRSAAPVDITRSAVTAIGSTYGSGVDVDGALDIVSSAITAEGPTAQGVESAASSAYTHVTIAVAAQNVGAGLLMNGQQELLLLASIIDVDAGVDARGAMIEQTTLLSVGNAWRTTAPTSCTVFRSGPADCFSFADLQTCAFLGCGASVSDVVYTGAPAPSVPVLDRGAPPAAFVDADGDCRLATDVEAGADELP